MQLWQPALPERYTMMSEDALNQAIEARRRELGDALVILGHHYQTDEVIRHADFTGDSFRLSQLAAERVRERGASHIIFCGVHFMAESADILAPRGTNVILPDISAGCSMADMAAYDDVVEAWDAIHETLADQGWTGRIVPVTYMNSTAAIKAFVGERQGAVCTSSNARRVFEWAIAGGAEGDDGDVGAARREQSRSTSISPRPTRTRGAGKGATLRRGAPTDIKIMFFPDQHLGRNTAAAFGLDVASQTCLYDPRLTRKGDPLGGASPEQLLRSSVILWAGHCSVHKLFRPEHCDHVRATDPAAKILVHPECCKEVVDKSDLNGSTEFIIRTIQSASPGSRWVVGTEVHLVNRLAREAAQRDVHVSILSDCQCLCTTMYRIDEPHLLWTLDNLAEGRIVNRVQVHPEARKWALVALERMLALTAEKVAVD